MGIGTKIRATAIVNVVNVKDKCYALALRRIASQTALDLVKLLDLVGARSILCLGSM